MGSIPITGFLVFVFLFFLFIKSFNLRFLFARFRFLFSVLSPYLDKIRLYRLESNRLPFFYLNWFFFYHSYLVLLLNQGSIGTFGFKSDKKLILMNANSANSHYSRYFVISSKSNKKLFNLFNRTIIVILFVSKRWLSWVEGGGL
jgi:hypothetical protein